MRATEPVTYDVYPYGLIYHRGTLYLVGHSVLRNEVCHWKVGRIEAVELTPVHFQRPEGFDLRKHLDGSFGVFHGDGDVRVKVRFAAAVTRYVSESKWHHSQRLIPQKDGSLVAEFQLSNTEEIKRWIMSFGPNALVLSPPSLREEIASDLETMSQAYAMTKRVTA
jgi:predicted DNA-binding transcriptional regulator YafY